MFNFHVGSLELLEYISSIITRKCEWLEGEINSVLDAMGEGRKKEWAAENGIKFLGNNRFRLDTKFEYSSTSYSETRARWHIYPFYTNKESRVEEFEVVVELDRESYRGYERHMLRIQAGSRDSRPVRIQLKTSEESVNPRFEDALWTRVVEVIEAVRESTRAGV